MKQILLAKALGVYREQYGEYTYWWVKGYSGHFIVWASQNKHITLLKYFGEKIPNVDVLSSSPWQNHTYCT